MADRDIVVIGASAGGVQALIRMVHALPLRFPAAIFVVLHTSPSGPGLLDKVLNRTDGTRARYAHDGMKTEPGKIYIAPPDFHMLLEPQRLRIVRGPKQNGNRPAIDVLFRSAAKAYGDRVIGVVLTGFLNDGSAGLAAIKSAGGIAIVQDPEDAQVSAMPAQALARAHPDYCLPLDKIPELLKKLVTGGMEDMPMPKRNHKNKTTNGGFSSKQHVERELSGLTCPACHGAVWEVREGVVVRYQCRVGHSYSPESMMDAQTESLERALWAALRELEEGVVLARRLAEYSHHRNRDKASDVFKRQAREKENHATVLRTLLQGKGEEIARVVAAAERAREKEIHEPSAA
jgi:two-component system chemotaxis response regulator CheB